MPKPTTKPKFEKKECPKCHKMIDVRGWGQHVAAHDKPARGPIAKVQGFLNGHNAQFDAYRRGYRDGYEDGVRDAKR